MPRRGSRTAGEARPDLGPGADPGPDPARGVYGISVAAQLVGADPQSLRLYERRGLLEPARTPGGTRRYSADDVTRLARIGALLDDGLNLAGVSAVLDLEADNARLRARLDAHEAAEGSPDGGRPGR
ncbi:MerR family transcriptional regulator [Georgenia sp. M64]|uniref:MerR family transcriptional regulator n=1 Tax=Georgenia sp. M64 TaxID=3120520 RepID=UPI0030E28FED